MKHSKRTRTSSRWLSPQRDGSMIVLTAVSMVILLAFAALLIDVAWMSTIQSEAQLASDIAARGALTSFVNDKSEDSYDARVRRAQSVGETLFENTTVGRATLQVDPEAFVFGVRAEDGTFSNSTRGTANAVEVQLTNLNPDGFGLFLGPLFGVDTFNTSASTTVSFSPIDVVLCLDISRSMAWRLDRNRPPASVGTILAPPVEGSRWIALVKSVNQFLEQAEEQAPSLRISLITFGGGIRGKTVTVWDNEQARVQNEFEFIGAARAPIEASLEFISSEVLAGSTAVLEGLELAHQMFRDDSLDTTEKICILLSDGVATTGSPLEVAEALGLDGITIHGIYFAGDVKGLSQLQSVADAGGGMLLHADSTTQLDEAFNRILALLSVSLVE